MPVRCVTRLRNDLRIALLNLVGLTLLLSAPAALLSPASHTLYELSS